MSNMAQNDTADAPGEVDEQLKKRARRRLVGAIALVLLAVIVLPMVMDHEPRPTGPEIQVRIPSQDGPAFEGRVAPSKTAGSAAAAPVATSAVPVAEEKPRSPVAASEKLKAASEAKPEVKEAEPKVEHKLEPKAEPKAEKKPAAPESKKSEATESVRAAAVIAGGAGSEQWVVQLGAYQEAGRVKLLLGKLKELGVPAFTEKVDTPQGQRTRVRAGPFSSRDAAVKAQERVKIIGVTGPVAPK